MICRPRAAEFCPETKPHAMTVIVPLDFSPQSINAASFAAQMLTGVYGADLLLYHLYLRDDEEAQVLENLQKVKEALQANSIVKIRCTAEKGAGFVGALSHLIAKQDASLVVMSVSDRVKIFEDSYSLQMMSQSACPVLVIPYGYMYSDVKTVVLTSDFKDVGKTIPVEKVKRVLELFTPQLHILHVNPEIYVSLSEELEEQRRVLAEMFAAYRPEFHFLTTNNFAESLDRFITDKNVDLVLTFPRKHSYFASLLRGTNTQKLVYSNSVPVLAAQE